MIDSSAPEAVADNWTSYFRITHAPIVACCTIAPLLVVFETARRIGPDAARPQLIAERLLDASLVVLGPIGWLAPGLILLVALIAWPIVLKSPLRLMTPRLVFGMLIESLILAAPLLVLAAIFSGNRSGGGSLLYAFGAGVYEELVFRWVLIGGGAWVATHLSGLAPSRAALIMAGVSAIVFALCHLQPIGGEEFTSTRLMFRGIAGAYLALLYLGRGLPLAVGAHVTYNALRVLAG